MSRIPKMSARKLARFRSENAGAYPRSTIQRKEKSCIAITARSAKKIGVAEEHQDQPASSRRSSSASRAATRAPWASSKPIPSRKKRSTTPIRSKPFEGRLDKRSHWTASGNLKLFGNDKKAMRRVIFLRAYDRCEAIVSMDFMPEQTKRCPNAAWEWSHKPCIHIKTGSGHGQGFKCDSELCGAAECGRCHRNSHGQY